MSEKILYRIKPQDKKSVEAMYHFYRTTDTGDIVGWCVRELYRWGQGFVESIDELPYLDSPAVYVDPNMGDGCELEDNISIDFEFDEEMSDQERQLIEEHWCNGDPSDEYGRCGLAWIYDFSDWEVEQESVIIYGPLKVDKITYVDYNIVSEEEIKLQPRPKLDKNDWPLP